MGRRTKPGKVRRNGRDPADTGVGIAPEDQEAVFVRSFVELHGGGIWVKSQVGGGSTFTFTLPVRRGA